MKTLIPLILGPCTLLVVACKGTVPKAPQGSPSPKTANVDPPLRLRDTPKTRTIEASSEGSLSLLGIHPRSASIQEHPIHLLELACSFDYPVEGDVVVRFLDAQGAEQGRTQAHIKSVGSQTVLKITVPSAVPAGKVTAVHLKLPE